MSQDAFKTLTGARHHYTPEPDDTLHRLRTGERIVPRYQETPHGYPLGYKEPIPEDAFEVPPYIQSDNDKSLAADVRHAASTFNEAVRHAKAMGLSIDVAWDDDSGKLFITIVREF